MQNRTREDLELLRQGLLAAFARDDNDGVKAQLAGQLRAVIRDLAELAPAEKGKSAADEITARREARRAGADDSSHPSRSRESRSRTGSRRSS